MIALGALLIVVPMILTLPTKSADADDLNDALRPVYNQELIDGAQASLATVGAMGTELQTGMLPALSTSLNMTGDELQQFLGANFPATATALQGMPESMRNFEGFTAVFAANLDNYETVEPVAFTPIIWTLIIGGIVILLAGGYCLVTKQ